MSLVLTRRERESIVIDGDIVVTVERIGDTSVRLSIAAPDDVEIWRDEIWRQLTADRQAGS